MGLFSDIIQGFDSLLWLTPYKAGLLWHDPGFSAIRATGLTYFGGDFSNLGVEGQSNDYSYRAYIPIVLAATLYRMPGFVVGYSKERQNRRK